MGTRDCSGKKAKWRESEAGGTERLGDGDVAHDPKRRETSEYREKRAVLVAELSAWIALDV